MENQFFVDSEHLSSEALDKKHRLENDPSFRKNHMEYMPGMEIIESDVCASVMSQMNSYDYSKSCIPKRFLSIDSIFVTYIIKRLSKRIILNG